MKKNVLTVIMLLSFLFAAITSLHADAGYSWRKQVVLETDAAVVAIDLGGGAFTDFRMAGSELNPLSWRPPKDGETKPQPTGHFLCFDRWGQPSKAETENGMPFHGEATSVEWKEVSAPVSSNGMATATVSCTLPLGGLTLERTVGLSEKAAVMSVRETITNVKKLGRVYNIVQHPSIAAPFLDESVIVDCNASKGFIQGHSWPEPDSYTIYWPEIAYKGKYVDLRRLYGDHNPGVTSFVFDEKLEYGWVTASNAAKNLIIGYIWKIDEYPWLNIWRNAEDGKPSARGIEFGTTGLHRPFADMIECGTIFDIPLYEFIDAQETITKSYIAFQTEIPADFEGVGDISHQKGLITISESKGSKNRTIKITY